MTKKKREMTDAQMAHYFVVLGAYGASTNAKIDKETQHVIAYVCKLAGELGRASTLGQGIQLGKLFAENSEQLENLRKAYREAQKKEGA